MPRKYLTFHLIILITGPLVGFSIKHFNFKENTSFRSIAQGHHDSQYYRYFTERCISLEEYVRLLKEFNVSFQERYSDYSCEPSNLHFKIANMLYFIDNYIKLDIPSWWKGGATEALKDMKGYFKKRVNRIVFRSNEGDPVFLTSRLIGGRVFGYNFLKTIYINTAIFKETTFLNHIRMLVHEAQHSELGIPQHVDCKKNVTHKIRGCDEWFTIGKKAGAYAHDISFILGLARLTLDMKEYPMDEFSRASMINATFVRLDNRINNPSPFFSLWLETLIVSDQEDFYYIHPFLEILIRIPKDMLFMLIKHSEHIFKREDMYEFIMESKDIFALFPKIKDVSGLFLKLDKVIEDTRISRLSISTDTVENFGMNDSMTIYGNGVVITNKEFLFIDIPSENLEKLKIKNTFQDPAGKGWIDIYSGANPFLVHGINKDGIHYYYNLHENDIFKSDFQIRDAISYTSSDFFQVLLDSENRLFIKGHLEDEVFQIDLSDQVKVKKIYYVKALALALTEGWNFHDRSYEYKSIVDQCNFTVKHSIDPWTGLVMGITADHQLAFQVSLDRCQHLPIEDKVIDYKINYQDSLYKKTNRQLVITIETADGKEETKLYYPYSYK